MVALISIAILAFFQSASTANVGCGMQAAGYEPYDPKFDQTNNVNLWARPHSWPWIISQASDYYYGWTPSGHFCGGSLLRVRAGVEASDMVLTAAHCVDDRVSGTWVVRANVHWQSFAGNVKTRDVVNFRRPPGYRNFYEQDIALLKLDQPINFTDTIRPVCLPTQGEELPVGRYCISAGWGQVSLNEARQNERYADELRQLEIPVHDEIECANMESPKFNRSVSFCAGPLDGRSGVCHADSGSPLVCRSPGRWVQYGIISYLKDSTRCIAPDSPAVYTKVSYYVNWIEHTIRDISSLWDD